MEKRYLSGEKYGINNVLLTYICDGASGSVPVSRDVMLPSVAYIKDGKICDTLFDTFLFLPAPNYVRAGVSNKDAGMASLDQKNWKDYIENEVYTDGMNLDALDAATGEMKKELGLEDYKTNVIFSLFYPVRAVTEFGEVESRMLDLSKLEDRKAAVKWMVDENIAQFNKRGYKNIKIAGFYWFCEAINYNNNDPDIIKVIGYITDYIRSLDMVTMWLPYFLANSYEKGRSFGFDLMAMQPNFFPSKDLPNAGGEERLYQTAELALKYDIGVEMECELANEPSVTNLKKYYRAGVKTGYIDAFHAFYFQRGPLRLFDIFNSDDAYIRSAYDDTYKFIRKTLVHEEMEIKE